MSTEDTSTDKQTKGNILNTLSEDDFNIINLITKNIDNIYGLTKKEQQKLKQQGKTKNDFRTAKKGVYFSNQYNKTKDGINYYTGMKDKPNSRKRADMLLNNKDKIEEYFNEHPNETFDKNTYIEILEEIKEKSTPESEKQAQQTITTLESDKQQLIEKNSALSKDNEELTQQKDKAQQAFKDSKDIQHQKFADQSNNIKELQDKINDYEQRFKELEKAPLKRNYINDKVFNESYSLDKGELMNVIKNDVEKHMLPEDTDIEQIADAIYAKATKRIYKNLKRINNMTALTGYNPDIYNKLPAEVAEIIKNHINDKIQEDIRKKNIRYILPKEKPRWEKAMQKYNLNPMLGRGAYTI